MGSPLLTTRPRASGRAEPLTSTQLAIDCFQRCRFFRNASAGPAHHAPIGAVVSPRSVALDGHLTSRQGQEDSFTVDNAATVLSGTAPESLVNIGRQRECTGFIA